MKIVRTIALVAILLAGATRVSALTLAYSGELASDDEIVWLPAFTLSTPFSVGLQTWSFGGGVNAAATPIAAGGFAPVISLFEAEGDQTLLSLSQAGVAGCGAGAADAATGYCWDIGTDIALAAGSYVIALTQDDNLPLGPWRADGFLRQGAGNFTGGPFQLFTGDLRDGHWALDITLPDPNLSVPLPGSLGLVLLALLALTTLDGAQRRYRAVVPSARTHPIKDPHCPRVG